MDFALVTVWWCEEWQCWAVTRYNEIGDQVGESDWCSYHSDAIDRARSMQIENMALEVVIFTKEGKESQRRTK